MEIDYPHKPFETIELCYWCGVEFEDGKPVCSHPELTEEVIEAGVMLWASDFCDHFCCGMPAMLCRSVRLAEEIKRHK